jgi:SAM-dependent methyltransferase
VKTISPIEAQSSSPDSSQFSERDAWEREYGYLHSIPSSVRESPAKILVELWRHVSGIPDSPLVLDAGCGSGRNSLYLAQQGCRIAAVDFSTAALDVFRKRVSELSLHPSVKIHEASLAAPLPFDSDSFHVVLDIYVSCHFVETECFTFYWQELRRILVPGGFALAAFFGTHDEYYAPLISESSVENCPVVRDPINGIAKRLYTGRDLERLFRENFMFRECLPLRFGDSVHNRVYRREVLGLLLQNDKTP